MVVVRTARARRKLKRSLDAAERYLETEARETVAAELEDLVGAAARRWGNATGRTGRAFRVKARSTTDGFVVVLENTEPSARYQSPTRYAPTYFETLIVKPLRKRAHEIGERVLLELVEAA